jgi:hypothetical protein
MTKSTAPKFHHSSVIKTTAGDWYVKVTYLADRTLGVKRGPFETSNGASAQIPEMVAELRELVAKGAKTPVAAAVPAARAAAEASLIADLRKSDDPLAAAAVQRIDANAAKRMAAECGLKFPTPADAAPVYTVARVSRPMGREGPGLKCDLLKNGRVIATMADYGDGAMVNLHFIGEHDTTVHGFNYKDEPHDYVGTKEEAEFTEFLKALPKAPADPRRGLPEMRVSAEVWVEDRANDIAELARFNRLLKTNVFFQRVDGQVASVKRPAGDIGVWSAGVLARSPKLARCLEGVPVAELAALVRANS